MCCCAALDVSSGTLSTALQASRFDRSKPTLWVLEGLTYYLSRDDNQLLFGSMAALSAAGSMFAATMAPQTIVDRSRAKGRGLMAQWKWGFTPDFSKVRSADCFVGRRDAAASACVACSLPRVRVVL